jgi:hypothetical protein
MDDPQVLALFARQHWVASVWQLRRLGVSKEALRRALELELLERVSPGIYKVTAAILTLEGKAMALLLQTPPGSFISGTTAGTLYRLRRMALEPVEITVSITVRRHLPAWARLVRCRSVTDERDVVRRPDGLVVSSPLRTLFRLAVVFNQFRFERAAEDMWHLGLVTPGQAADYLADIRRSGRAGVAAMERWLKRTEAIERPSQSGLEQEMLALVVASGLPEPVRQHPLLLLNGDLIHIDMAWPDIRFGLEPGHSWWHGGDAKQRSDQARDRACIEVGWYIVRIDEKGIKEPGLAGQIRRIYQQQAALVGSSPDSVSIQGG